MERSASSIVPPMAVTSKAAELLALVREVKVPDSGRAALELCGRGETVGILMEASGLMISAGVVAEESVISLKTCLDNFETSFRAHGGDAVKLIAEGLSFQAICSNSGQSGGGRLALDQQPVFKNLWRFFKAFKAGQASNSRKNIESLK